MNTPLYVIQTPIGFYRGLSDGLRPTFGSGDQALLFVDQSHANARASWLKRICKHDTTIVPRTIE